MVSVLLLLAGSSQRMNSKINKVFLPLGDKPVYAHSLELFLKFGLEVICVVKEGEEHHLKPYVPLIKIVNGGNTRQESVYRGLCAAKGDQILIHDAARPHLKEQTLQDCLSALKEEKAVLVGCFCKDTIYHRNPLAVLNRQELFQAQTPQGGPKEALIKAYRQAMKENVSATDDLSLLLKYSPMEVLLIDGTDQNFKITTQLDYILSKEMMKNV